MATFVTISKSSPPLLCKCFLRFSLFFFFSLSVAFFINKSTKSFQDGKKVGTYNGAERTAIMIVDWVESFEDDLSEDEEDITDVATLTSENFKRRVSEGNWIIDLYVFLLANQASRLLTSRHSTSYAPWCGHCKQLTPIWDELALTENPAGRVKVGKVDCSRWSGKLTSSSHILILFLLCLCC